MDYIMSRLQINLWLAASLLTGLSLPAQPAVPGTAPDKQKKVLPAPAPLPPTQSPIALFRELLALTPAARERQLAEKYSKQQTILRTKLAEYEALSPPEREFRLRATELRWYMMPLMRMAPSNRADRLVAVPDIHRELIMARLKQWDQLPVSSQREFLTNQTTIEWFLRLESSTPRQREVILTTISPQDRQQIETNIQRIASFSPEKRQELFARFRSFCELDAREQARILGAVSVTQLPRAQKTLVTLQNLPKAQRDLCLEGLTKFTTLTAEERQEFFKNCERWKAMSPAERNAWRALIARVNVPSSHPLPDAVRSPAARITNQ
jgi:hypothetical protein